MASITIWCPEQHRKFVESSNPDNSEAWYDALRDAFKQIAIVGKSATVNGSASIGGKTYPTTESDLKRVPIRREIPKSPGKGFVKETVPVGEHTMKHLQYAHALVYVISGAKNSEQAPTLEQSIQSLVIEHIQGKIKESLSKEFDNDMPPKLKAAAPTKTKKIVKRARK